eukprot:2491731-Prymnesium_polylepis.1
MLAALGAAHQLTLLFFDRAGAAARAERRARQRGGALPRPGQCGPAGAADAQGCARAGRAAPR